MKEFLWRKFVKDYENYKDPEVRVRYTKLTGTLGIIVNSVLCIVKIILGFGINSIAVIADGFHDMADSLAACITLIAARIARIPADKNHPYGHARVEYLASLCVSAIVLIVGYQLMRTSISKCIHPEPTDFSWIMVAFLIFAILLKGSQALFTVATGKHIKSLPVIAAGTDNRNDVITTIVIVIGMLIHHFAGLDLDGYMGCLVSLFILYSGFKLIKETINPLLGEPPDEDLIAEMTEIITEPPEILGAHDIVVYNYGPGRTFASFHVEIDSDSDLMEIHNVIDHIEYELMQRLNINAAGHMDPVDIDDPIRIRMKTVIEDTIRHIDCIESYHDLRIVNRTDHKHVVVDLVMTPGSEDRKNEVYEKVSEAVNREGDNFQLIINYDHPFI